MKFVFKSIVLVCVMLMLISCSSSDSSSSLSDTQKAALDEVDNVIWVVTE